jgi:hypothetical protein
MPAKIERLLTRHDRLRADQAAALRQMILAFPDMPPHIATEVVATIDRQTAANNGWTFVMLSPEQNRIVVRHLKAESRYPMLAVVLWAECFMELCHDTGEIAQTREQLAESAALTPQQVSTIMNELERFGAIIRRMETVPGMGRRVRYFMNPLVGTKLAGAARDRAQAEAPALRLVPREGIPA